MRIQKSPKHIAKSLLKSSTKKLPLAVASIFVLASGVLLAQNLTKPEVAMAITPPDSCFAFNSGTGTITDYYDNQADNPANPACPRAVDIPSTIGGVSVTAIAAASNYWDPTTATSFANKSLTSVTIPGSITSIGARAFAYNQLTSVYIAGNPTVLGSDILVGNSHITTISYNGTTYTENPTTPEACYNFSSGTITGYKLYDLNLIKSSGIACISRNLDIPSTIAGVAVTGIGNYAFYSKELTSVTVGDNVSIGEGAFESNQLTSVTIGDSVSIDYWAFANNQLTSVALGDNATIGEMVFVYNQLTSVTLGDNTSVGLMAFAFQSSLGADLESTNGLDSSDPATVQATLDSLWYVRLYTNDPTNLDGLVNEMYSESVLGGDFNNNGIDDPLGGVLINPARLYVEYTNSSGTNLAPSQSLTGTINGTPLTNYLAKDGPAMVTVADPYDITSEEQLAIDQALAVYYRLGDEATVNPPSVEDYITPPSKTFTLTNPSTIGSFTYQPVATTNPGDTTPKPLTRVDFSAPSGSKSNPTANSVPSSLPPAMANSTFSVDTTKECSTIDSAKLLPASDFTPPANTATNQVTLGGLDFTLSCTAPGKNAKVSLTLASEVSDPSTIQVYKQTASGKVTNITKQTTITSQDNKTTITYNLTDGGELDDDSQVNGQITDPIFITVPADSELLAETGMSQSAVVVIAAVMLGGAVILATARSSLRQECQ